jgi:hypothetical protein
MIVSRACNRGRGIREERENGVVDHDKAKGAEGSGRLRINKTVCNFKSLRMGAMVWKVGIY